MDLVDVEVTAHGVDIVDLDGEANLAIIGHRVRASSIADIEEDGRAPPGQRPEIGLIAHARSDEHFGRRPDS
ncbi:MAG TPA: hypothetical protein VE575_04065 [Acidimicrobiales bacterium]|nr:hypothetical protein [Acidimicrobiales bacterium]